jgi:hypothetical protein
MNNSTQLVLKPPVGISQDCKTTIAHMSRTLTLLAVGLLAASVLVGCTSNRTIRSQSDFDSLPRSSGAYGGSFIVHPWSYAGSDASYEHFIYTHTRDNLPKHTHVRVVRGLVVLSFTPRPYRLPGDGLPVTPEYRNGKVSGFSIDTNTISLHRDAVK